MNRQIQKVGCRLALVCLALVAVPSMIWAETNVDSLAAKMAALEEELATLRQEFEVAKRDAAAANAEAAEWRSPTSVVHLAGYAAVGYTDAENETGSFDVANFNPIFHYQYGDRVLWEAELEFEIEEDGETEVGLEYTTIDLFLNDYMTFVGGKFLSPLGQFRQNLHPAWINKLPAAPPGFGHDGAAPLADIGFQLRGGVPVGNPSALNYAVYVANGPELEGEDGEVEAIEAEGFTRDVDGEKVWGGRIGYRPIPNFEVGVSAAVGKAAVTVNDGEEVEDDPERDYDAFGIDAAFAWNGLELRGEYIQQDVDDSMASIAPEGGKWEAWYAQAAYQFAQARWEGVLRYTDFDSPHASQQQEQIALGLNYLIAPSALVKLAYEFNDGLSGTPNDADRWLVQLAYGY